MQFLLIYLNRFEAAHLFEKINSQFYDLTKVCGILEFGCYIEILKNKKIFFVKKVPGILTFCCYIVIFD